MAGFERRRGRRSLAINQRTEFSSTVQVADSIMKRVPSKKWSPRPIRLQTSNAWAMMTSLGSALEPPGSSASRCIPRRERRRARVSTCPLRASRESAAVRQLSGIDGLSAPPAAWTNASSKSRQADAISGCRCPQCLLGGTWTRGQSGPPRTAMGTLRSTARRNHLMSNRCSVDSTSAATPKGVVIRWTKPRTALMSGAWSCGKKNISATRMRMPNRSSRR